MKKLGGEPFSFFIGRKYTFLTILGIRFMVIVVTSLHI